MNIFLACPVRNVDEKFRLGIEAEIAHLESHGHTVHYPPRDTNQNDSSGLRICLDNCQAIRDADVVYVAWDGQSQGVLFDLGMAFAMGKAVRVLGDFMPEATDGKSFQNMVYKLERYTKKGVV